MERWLMWWLLLIWLQTWESYELYIFTIFIERISNWKKRRLGSYLLASSLFSYITSITWWIILCKVLRAAGVCAWDFWSDLVLQVYSRNAPNRLDSFVLGQGQYCQVESFLFDTRNGIYNTFVLYSVAIDVGRQGMDKPLSNKKQEDSKEFNKKYARPFIRSSSVCGRKIHTRWCRSTNGVCIHSCQRWRNPQSNCSHGPYGRWMSMIVEHNSSVISLGSRLCWDEPRR